MVGGRTVWSDGNPSHRFTKKILWILFFNHFTSVDWTENEKSWAIASTMLSELVVYEIKKRKKVIFLTKVELGLGESYIRKRIKSADLVFCQSKKSAEKCGNSHDMFFRKPSKLKEFGFKRYFCWEHTVILLESLSNDWT